MRKIAKKLAIIVWKKIKNFHLKISQRKAKQFLPLLLKTSWRKSN